MQEGPIMSPNGLLAINGKNGIQYVRSQNIDASWSSFEDFIAGIYQYEYTLVGNDDKVFTPYASSIAESPAAAVSLAYEEMQHNLALFFKVRARNFGGALSDIIESPVIVDLHPPQCRSFIHAFNKICYTSGLKKEKMALIIRGKIEKMALIIGSVIN